MGLTRDVMDSLESNGFTFVLSTWIDDSDPGDSEEKIVGRGEIKNVTAEKPERLVFDSLDDLPTLLRRFLGDLCI